MTDEKIHFRDSNLSCMLLRTVIKIPGKPFSKKMKYFIIIIVYSNK